MPSKLDDWAEGPGKKPPAKGGKKRDPEFSDTPEGRRLDEIWGGKARGGLNMETFRTNVKAVPRNAVIETMELLDKPRQLIDKTPVGRLADWARDENPKGILGWARNTAVDIAEDPLSYVTGGTSKGAKLGLQAIAKTSGKETAEAVAKKGARRVLTPEARAAAGKALAAAEGGSEKAAAKVMRQVDRSAQGGVRFAGRTVVPGRLLEPVTSRASQGVRDLADTPLGKLQPRSRLITSRGRDFADDFGSLQAQARAAAAVKSHEAVDRIYRAARAAKATTEDLDIVTRALDVNGAEVVVPPRLQPLVEELATLRDDATARQVAAGVLSNTRDEYVPLRLTKQGKKALVRAPDVAEQHGVRPSILQLSARQEGHALPRRLMPDSPLHDVESVVGGRLRSQGSLKGPLLQRNPLHLIGRRIAVAERALAHKQFLDNLTELRAPGGERIFLRADPTIARPLGWERLDIGDLGSYYAPVDIADELETAFRTLNDDAALAEFKNVYDTATRAWKAMATGPLIGGFGFQLRNATGNVFNAWLAGVKNPAVYTRAAKIQTTLRRAGGDVSKLSLKDRRVVELAQKHGVLDSGFYLVEVAEGHGKLRRATRIRGTKERLGRIGQAVNPLDPENIAVKHGRSLSSAVENNARLGMFIDQLGKLGDADHAARQVRKYLFDYADVTDADRAIRRASAFWTFMRKNTPLQLAEMARQPGKFAGVAHAQHRAAEMTLPGDFPDYQPQNAMFPIDDSADPLVVGVDLPFFAALETLDPSSRNFWNRVAGPGPNTIKLLAESATGKDLFTGNHLYKSGPQRAADAYVPLVGKTQRSPLLGLLRNDPQFRARLLSSLTGLQARREYDAR